MSITFAKFQKMIEAAENYGACDEAIEQLRGFKTVEEFLSHEESPEWAYLYAKFVLKRRFPQGEEVIKKDKDYWQRYKKHFNIKE